MNTALEVLEDLDDAERQRAMMWLSETLGTSVTFGSVGSPPPQAGSPPAAAVAPSVPQANVQDQTPKEFVASKQPATDVERLTCLAYFLTKARDVPAFNTAELTELNTEAAGRKFTNAASTGKNATNQNGYLAGAGGKKRQITHLGEQVVEAMPDRDAVKAVLATAPKPKRAKRSGRSKASKSGS